MSKQQRTLSAIATALVSLGNTSIQQRMDRAALKAQAATLSAAEKAKVDEEVVTYYAAKCGVTVHERSKASSKGYGMICADFERVDGSIVDKKQNAAQTAISECRKILFADDTAAKPAAPKLSAFGRVIQMANKRAEQAEKISAGERREIRAAMAALASLLG